MNSKLAGISLVFALSTGALGAGMPNMPNDLTDFLSNASEQAGQMESVAGAPAQPQAKQGIPSYELPSLLLDGHDSFVFLTGAAKSNATKSLMDACASMSATAKLIGPRIEIQAAREFHVLQMCKREPNKSDFVYVLLHTQQRYFFRINETTKETRAELAATCNQLGSDAQLVGPAFDLTGENDVHSVQVCRFKKAD